MEFERALFRIHQRALAWSVGRKARLRAERVLPGIIVGLSVCLAVLHSDYVGQARCLPEALRLAGLWNVTGNTHSVPMDATLALSVEEGDVVTGLRLHMESDVRRASQQAESSTSSATEVEGAGLHVAGESKATLGGLPQRDVIASYRFVFDRELATMRPEIRASHGFRVYNITLMASCLTPSPLLLSLFRYFDAFDNAVINELAYTLRDRGYLDRVEGDEKIESWIWSREQMEAASPIAGRSLFSSLSRKAAILAKSVIAFVLVSAVTGFFIRVAVNGSAVLMFPAVVLAESYGRGTRSMAVLNRSFPWIGVHVEVLRRAGQPLWPLFRAHMLFLFLQSFIYLACDVTWRFILYRKSSPDGFEERIFGLCTVLELFNLVFVRSVNSAVVFPKLAAACVVYLHYYAFCSLYPFHTLAFAVCACSCGWVMAYCMNHFEEPALRADPFSHNTPTAAHPRGVYMPQLSPAWNLEMAPLWTMFYPPRPPEEFPAEARRHLSDEEYLMA